MSFTPPDYVNFPPIPPEPPASRNLRDAAFDGGGLFGALPFALYGQPLPNGDPPPLPGLVTSTVFDIGPGFNGELEIEFVLSVCKLPSIAVPNGATLTCEIWTYRIDTVLQARVPDVCILTQTLTGSGGAGTPSLTKSARPPSGAQYFGARVTFVGTGDCSWWNGLFYARF